MENHRFILSSDECELLVAFETASSMRSLSEVVGRDISNVSRTLAKIESKLPVVEKLGQRWAITPLGRELVQHIRDSMLYQSSLLKMRSSIRIGTNREIAARILGRNFAELIKLFPETQLRISAFESGVEQALLTGAIDIGIDCEKPFSPDIAFETLMKESIVVVCSPKFLEVNLEAIQSGSLSTLPHLSVDRMSPNNYIEDFGDQIRTLATFNDIATARSACETGVGWALLPKYAVKDELLAKRLVEIPHIHIRESGDGIWWLRSRKYLKSSVEKLREFIKTLELQ